MFRAQLYRKRSNKRWKPCVVDLSLFTIFIYHSDKARLLRRHSWARFQELSLCISSSSIPGNAHSPFFHLRFLLSLFVSLIQPA